MILRKCLKVQYFQEYDNTGASPLSLKWKFLLPKSRTRRQAFSDRQADTINEIVSRLTNLEASYKSHLSRLNSISDSLSSLQTSTTSATTSATTSVTTTSTTTLSTTTLSTTVPTTSSTTTSVTTAATTSSTTTPAG